MWHSETRGSEQVFKNSGSLHNLKKFACFFCVPKFRSTKCTSWFKWGGCLIKSVFWRFQWKVNHCLLILRHSPYHTPHTLIHKQFKMFFNQRKQKWSQNNLSVMLWFYYGYFVNITNKALQLHCTKIYSPNFGDLVGSSH